MGRAPYWHIRARWPMGPEGRGPFGRFPSAVRPEVMLTMGRRSWDDAGVAPPDRPHVIVHVAVALNGATRGFAPDLGQFYGIAAMWGEDVTLTGADTILAQEPAIAAAPPGPVVGRRSEDQRHIHLDARGAPRQWARLDALRSALEVVAISSPPKSP